MRVSSDDQLRAALSRALETDRLLGVRAVPLSVPTPSSAATAGPVPPAQPQSAAGSSAEPCPAPPKVSPEVLAQRAEALRNLDEQHVAVCTKCTLHETRTKTVFGQGSPAARLVFVGEAPGREEDLQGLAFVGRAGKLLTKMIGAMGLTRDEVFICNILKCRPPDNRDPAPDEVSSCWPYLDEQLQIIQPEVIVALGRPAAQTLLRTKESIGRLRGRWHDYYMSGMPMVGEPTPLMPTYHPAYLLRNPPDKNKAWSDLQQVMQKLGLKIQRR
jgi:DNA polymerase